MRVDAAVAVQVDYLLFCRLDGGENRKRKGKRLPNNTSALSSLPPMISIFYSSQF